MRGRCLSILEAVTTEMETYHDQRSENWRNSERGEEFIEMIESIAEIVAALRDLDPRLYGYLKRHVTLQIRALLTILGDQDNI